jgi:hypothetical protein
VGMVCGAQFKISRRLSLFAPEDSYWQRTLKHKVLLKNGMT